MYWFPNRSSTAAGPRAERSAAAARVPTATAAAGLAAVTVMAVLATGIRASAARAAVSLNVRCAPVLLLRFTVRLLP
jgi:hypothetical protein